MLQSSRNLLLALGLSLACQPTFTSLFAQAPAVPESQLVVDVVTLKSGLKLRGAVVERDTNGDLRFVCSTSWLRQHAAALYQQQVRDYQQQLPQIIAENLERIDAWLPETSPGSRIQIFLQQERARLKHDLDIAEPRLPEFCWLTLLAEDITKFRSPSKESQRIALWAWHEHLPDVESRSAAALKRELEGRQISLAGPAPDLSEQLPPLPQTEEEWAARRALLEYALQKPLDLQGMGTKLYVTEPGKAVDIGTLLPDILSREVKRLTDDLLGLPAAAPEPDQAWRMNAIRLAHQQLVHGVRVTRLLISGSNQIRIESDFLAEISPDHWETIWSDAQQGDPHVRRPDLEAQIANDPQLKKILEAVTAISPDAEAQLQTAMQVGSATQVALAASNAAFFRFRDRYLRHLDRPYLPLQKDITK